MKGVSVRPILWDVQKHTCNECISIEGLELIKLTAIYNSGNDLQSESGSKRTLTIGMLIFFEKQPSYVPGQNGNRSHRLNSDYRVEREINKCSVNIIKRHSLKPGVSNNQMPQLSFRNPPVASRLFLTYGKVYLDYSGALMLLRLYLPDVKIPFQVISNYSVEFLRGVQRGFAGLCGDLKPPAPADLH